jgi:2-haloacid dehalogenase
VRDRWATFDCYGTLADWIGGMSRALEPHAGPRTRELMDAYYVHELEVQAEQPGARYRDVLAESARRAARAIGLELPPGAEDALAERWGELPIFADVRPALGALRDAGWRLAILTNCDDDLLARTLVEIAVPFDELVTAQQVGAYKPALAHFEAFDARTSGRGTWVHCANSWVHDMQPGLAYGVPCVWVDRDRTGQDDSPLAAHLSGMADLPETLARFS